jgi:hypothetical protein
LAGTLAGTFGRFTVSFTIAHASPYLHPRCEINHEIPAAKMHAGDGNVCLVKKERAQRILPLLANTQLDSLCGLHASAIARACFRIVVKAAQRIHIQVAELSKLLLTIM